MNNEKHQIDWTSLSKTAEELDTSRSQAKAEKVSEKAKEMGIEGEYGSSFRRENFEGAKSSTSEVICPLCGKVEKRASGGTAYIKCPQCEAPMSRNLDKKRTAEEDKVD